MTADEPATSATAPQGPADIASEPERVPPPDPTLSWIPLLGSALITTLMLTLVIVAYVAK